MPLYELPRREALKKLRAIIGRDLREIAAEVEFDVYSKKTGNRNKGWAGLTLEKFLGLRINTKPAPNGEYWELKCTSVKKSKGIIVPKETMAITSLNAQDVLDKDFGNSKVYEKMSNMIVCARMYVDKNESSSPLLRVVTFDLLDPEIMEGTKRDYEMIRAKIRDKGFASLTRSEGDWIHAGTKGSKDSDTRSFYATKKLLYRILQFD